MPLSIDDQAKTFHPPTRSRHWLRVACLLSAVALAGLAVSTDNPLSAKLRKWTLTGGQFDYCKNSRGFVDVHGIVYLNGDGNRPVWSNLWEIQFDGWCCTLMRQEPERPPRRAPAT